MTTEPRAGLLPPVTLLIEWENAIDVADAWTERAMRALEAELEAQQARFSTPPAVLYLYNEKVVDESVIRAVVDKVAPKLPQLVRLRFVPTPGLSYYKLKNYGAQIADTPIVVMLDSDAGPQPGWLPGILAPFEDPEVMVVGGFTVFGHEDLVSKAMALCWIFNLPSERPKAAQRRTIHVNNCAVRTEFFRQHPFRDLPTFKKQCGFWRRELDRNGVRWVRTPDAMTIHAPWPSLRFLVWRAWTAGGDRDFLAHELAGRSRLARVAYALRFWLWKCARATYRIVTKHAEVDLPLWKVPAALLVGTGYYTIVLAGELRSALTRDFPATDLEEAAQE